MIVPQRLSEHPLRTLTHEVIDQRRRLTQLDAHGASTPAAGAGTTVNLGRTFPTSVGAPVLLENLHSITGKLRPSRSSTGLKHCSW